MSSGNWRSLPNVDGRGELQDAPHRDVEDVLERRFRRMIAAHAVHAAARRRRRRAEIHTANRRLAWVPPDDRSKEELAQGVGALTDVTAHEVGIARRQLSCRHHVTREHPFAESGRKALELGLDARQHVDGRAMRHVTVAPERVRAGRRAAGVEYTWLRNENRRTLGMLTATDGCCTRQHLVERSAEVERTRVATLVGTPGHGCRQRPIYLEDARSIAEPLECAAISTGQSIAHEMQDLSRRDVEQDGTRRGQIGEAANWCSRVAATT